MATWITELNFEPVGYEILCTSEQISIWQGGGLSSLISMALTFPGRTEVELRRDELIELYVPGYKLLDLLGEMDQEESYSGCSEYTMTKKNQQIINKVIEANFDFEKQKPLKVPFVEPEVLNEDEEVLCCSHCGKRYAYSIGTKWKGVHWCSTLCKGRDMHEERGRQEAQQRFIDQW